MDVDIDLKCTQQMFMHIHVKCMYNSKDLWSVTVFKDATHACMHTVVCFILDM